MVAGILLAAALTAAPPVAIAQPSEPTTLAGLIAQVEARATPTPALDAAREWVTRNGDVDLPLINANRAIQDVQRLPPECAQPVIAFEINAQPDGPDSAAMIYPGEWHFSWEPAPDPPGVTSPLSGVRFIFINVEQQFVGEIPWEWTGTRTIPLIPVDRAIHLNFPIRFSQLTEFGGGMVVGIFVGPDTPTNGPGCIYNQAIVANGNSTESCLHWLCPSGYPYNRYPSPYG